MTKYKKSLKRQQLLISFKKIKAEVAYHFSKTFARHGTKYYISLASIGRFTWDDNFIWTGCFVYFVFISTFFEL